MPCPCSSSGPVSSRHKCRGDGLVGAINSSPPPLDLPYPSVLAHPSLPSDPLHHSSCCVCVRRRHQTSIPSLVVLVQRLPLDQFPFPPHPRSSCLASGDCYDQIGELSSAQPQESLGGRSEAKRIEAAGGVWWLLPARSWAMDPSGGAFLPQLQAGSSSFPRSSSNTSLARTGSAGRGRGGTRGRKMMRRVCRGVITFIFAIAGLFLGAVTGGLIGLATESGLFRGTGIGAITGALVSIEVVDSSIRLWQSRRSGIWSILYVLNVIYSLLTGRLVREKVDPAVQRVVRSQMNAVDSSPFRESPDLFEVEATNGMPRASIDKLPESWITEEYRRDAVGDLSGCSVCLQDFQVGEKVRSLPDCWHVFHVPCIDGWLIKHGSCPLCRRKL